MKLATTLAGLLLAFAGCKDGKDHKKADTAAATAPAPGAAIVKPPGTDSRLRLAIAMPATLERGYVPHINLEITEEPMTLDAYKAELVEQEEPPTSAQALPDGWIVQLADGDLVRSVVQRTLGKRTYRCESEGDDQAAHDLGRASCLAMTFGGGTIVVPFAIPTDDGASVGIDALSLDIRRADADSPPTPERVLEDTGWNKTGKLLRKERTSDGFIAIVEGRSGDLATNQPMFDAVVRSRLADLDLVCGPWSSSKAADEATQIVDACRTLRAY